MDVPGGRSYKESSYTEPGICLLLVQVKYLLFKHVALCNCHLWFVML